MTEPLYVGIDPGVNGGMVTLWPDGTVGKTSMPESESVLVALLKDLWRLTDEYQVCVALEQQQPRPTYFGGRSAILRSTCVLYGQYQYIRGVLKGLGVTLKEPLPKVWQRQLGIQPRAKGMTDTQWKGKLKGVAQALFPGEKVALATSDALLIAEWLRRLKEGSLERKARQNVHG